MALSEEEIERARRAIMDAPATESGLLIPPHVAEQRAKEAAEAASRPVPANRAQRRWQAKHDRRRARREAKLNAEKLAAMRDFEEATKNLSEPQLLAAVAAVKDMGKMSREELGELADELGGDAA